ncbi:CXXC motif containing zinc binding protein [Ditylenchus destructor]|uniref:CXXC motif containing zinc binding protein n=1 Tax=Ditylenchus destructor TaxID=166010 RepID=A0AAD4ND09_9BILA|nr:CXXC motif containing zinc binding protein [Ditylenchus destructor]
MPIIALQLKANLVNVTDLAPSEFNEHRWYLKLKCSGCGQESERWQYATVQESQELSKGHGQCHILAKCSFCSRQNSLEILPDSYASYSADKNEEYQTIVKFDCRGLDPVDFDPRVGWRCFGTESGTVFDDIDLNEKEWVDYDEKAGQATEINEMSSRFIVSKK